MLAKKAMMEDIRVGFSHLQHYIRPGGPTNLTDINVDAEDFVANVLNALHGWDLINMNRKVSNYPCLDLFSEREKIGVQVTAEEGSAKINDTLACLEDKGMSARITRFYHFSLVPKQGSYTIHKVPPGITFAWKTDILDFDSVFKQIQEASDDTIAAVQKVVRKSLPTIFAAEVNRLTALRSELHACQTIFDRAVMSAPFHREDPVEMYKAVRAMRIRLQKRGASRIPHETVANNFEIAKTVLSECEGEVRKKYPYIHEAAKFGVTPVYQGNDYGDAINLMMSIRLKIMPLLDLNDAVLDEIDLRLK
jgi:hypothetical protein